MRPRPDKPRTALQLTVDPWFGPFFWAKLLSSSGIWVHNIVLAIVAYEVTGSALVVGIVTAVQFAPQLALAPMSGKVADLGNPARQIVAGRFLVAVGSGGLAGWLWLVGGVEGLHGPWPLVASSFVVGMGLVVGGPAMQSIVPLLIKPGELPAATALNSVPMVVARGLGPGLGAVMASQLGAATALTVAAVANGLYGVVMLWLRLPNAARVKDRAEVSVRASLRHVRSDPALAALLLGIATIGVGADPSMTLTPALARELGGGARLVGWLASAFGIGTAVGLLLFGPARRWMRLDRLAPVGLVVMAMGVGALAYDGSRLLALAAFCVAGAGMTLAFTSITTLIQERTPDHLRGRIMALWFVGFLGARPFAAGVNGSLADGVSVDAALAATVVVVLAGAGGLRWRGRG